MPTQNRPDPAPLVQPFPQPGPRIRRAYRELDTAANGTDDQRKPLGDLAALARPWAPATCTTPQLRAELWTWLDAVVVWINHELVFDPVDVVPACWPHHPHVVHELAVLADQRRRAERALTSNPLEEWHRYAFPTFLDRMRHRIADHCTDTHPGTWPAAGRFTRHLDDARTTDRGRAYGRDIAAITQAGTRPGAERTGPHLRVIDADSAEIFQ